MTKKIEKRELRESFRLLKDSHETSTLVLRTANADLAAQNAELRGALEATRAANLELQAQLAAKSSEGSAALSAKDGEIVQLRAKLSEKPAAGAPASPTTPSAKTEAKPAANDASANGTESEAYGLDTETVALARKVGLAGPTLVELVTVAKQMGQDPLKLIKGMQSGALWS